MYYYRLPGRCLCDGRRMSIFARSRRRIDALHKVSPWQLQTTHMFMIIICMCVYIYRERERDNVCYTVGIAIITVPSEIIICTFTLPV